MFPPPFSTALLVVSDRASQGAYDDRTGPAISTWLSNQKNESLVRIEVVPDGIESVRKALMTLIDQGHELILTAGGTGLSPRDQTPEATLQVIDRLVPGISEAMRAGSALITPNAILSRAVSGVAKGSLIVNLPGSPKGAVENLALVYPALVHAIGQIKEGDSTDCAGPDGQKTGGIK